MPHTVDTASMQAIRRRNPRRKCSKNTSYQDGDTDSGIEIEDDTYAGIEIESETDSETESEDDSETESKCNISVVDEDGEENRANDDYRSSDDDTETDSESSDSYSDMCESDLEIAGLLERVELSPSDSKTSSSEFL
ncbi:hypothetical protein COCC4DRAFT_143553 [Bipolaris maydis ATCC 48331]|uniref:Uncharacterized protein n=2 Tax=Cochliobolus heterostrophus TaxID=5016 RepID=M2SN35_COCH5|nr:uncharacterized protein COCC4DRAFT_143553 [Bipolaris maydis ATCC 48331]EMD86745.1 hypothetical protein COCHEDRAFT_1034511 [Bipolaris maydis C5]ENI03137.1 hypothetical protein COCC4DRAFT_143553 [Bipolaris maydis ATCC 48331]KAJ5052534.1 hypothetical protein J3E74DRAFT_295627 [Bipolaris maydis]KAJ6267345.1 hypothetical protein PSV08DRAFT_250520 [Bipolaris maydis]